MEGSRVLIVSDSPDRRNFLEYYVRSHNMSHLLPQHHGRKKGGEFGSFFNGCG